MFLFSFGAFILKAPVEDGSVARLTIKLAFCGSFHLLATFITIVFCAHFYLLNFIPLRFLHFHCVYVQPTMPSL